MALEAPREGAVLGTAGCVNVAGIVPQLYSVGLSGADSEILIKSSPGFPGVTEVNRGSGGGSLFSEDS